MNISKIIICPFCKSSISPLDSKVCSNCVGRELYRSNVLIAKDVSNESYFDDRFEAMISGNEDKGTWDLFYKDQIDLLQAVVKSSEIILDIGCGPQLPYQLDQAQLIGLDPSFASILVNNQVALKVFGSADSIPFLDRSIDRILCFYSIHHMTGNSVSENRLILKKVLKEFSRVLKPSGELMIFDLSPKRPFNFIQSNLWNMSKRYLGQSLDMFFWQDKDLACLVEEIMPQYRLKTTTFHGKNLVRFSPIFNVPNFKIPRWLYPFDINLYTWKLN
jgi:ubiquinone/menaquinone biosynthesis C-methylase UbiE